MSEVPLKNQPGHNIAKGEKRQKVQITNIISLWEDGASAAEIGSIVGITEQHVRRLLKKAGYENEGRRSKHHKEIERALGELIKNPLKPIHHIVKDKNVRRAVKAKWDQIKDKIIADFMEECREEIQKIKEFVRLHPEISFKEMGYEDPEQLEILKKDEEFKTIKEIRDSAIFQNWEGIYLLHGQNIQRLIKKGVIERNKIIIKQDDEESVIDDGSFNESGRKRNKKGGDYSRNRILEMMK